MTYTVEVTNAGAVAGATSVLGFVRSDQAGAPPRQLFAFDKVYLEPGQAKKVVLVVPAAAGSPGAATAGPDGAWRILPGRYRVDIEGLRYEHALQGDPVTALHPG